MFCPHCGERIDQGDPICEYCNKPTTEIQVIKIRYPEGDED